MNDVQILVKAKDFIDTPEKWIKGRMFVNSDGQYANSYDEVVVKMCADAAISKAMETAIERRSFIIEDFVLTSQATQIIDSVITDMEYRKAWWRNVLRLKFRRPRQFMGWILTTYNDNKTTTHKDMMRLFDKAIARAKKIERKQRQLDSKKKSVDKKENSMKEWISNLIKIDKWYIDEPYEPTSMPKFKDRPKQRKEKP